MRGIYNNEDILENIYEGYSKGNAFKNLYDPYKKRPIILVDKKYQKEDKFILVPYHTINGEGLLKCIKPEKVYIEKIGYKTNLLMAFSSSPSRINGVEVLLHKDLMKGW